MKTKNEILESLKEHIYTGGDEPAVYCGTYKKYNEGSLFGEWLDMTTFADSEEFFEVCASLHSDEDEPEFMFQDFMNFPEHLYSESMTGKEVEKIIEYAELDEDEKEILESYCRATGNEEADISTAKNRYMGEWESFTDFAEETWWETHPETPEYCAQYLDFKAYARDLEPDYYTDETGGSCKVFAAY